MKLDQLSWDQLEARERAAVKRAEEAETRWTRGSASGTSTRRNDDATAAGTAAQSAPQEPDGADDALTGPTSDAVRSLRAKLATAERKVVGLEGVDRARYLAEEAWRMAFPEQVARDNRGIPSTGELRIGFLAGYAAALAEAVRVCDETRADYVSRGHISSWALEGVDEIKRRLLGEL